MRVRLHLLSQPRRALETSDYVPAFAAGASNGVRSGQLAPNNRPAFAGVASARGGETLAPNNRPAFVDFSSYTTS